MSAHPYDGAGGRGCTNIIGKAIGAGLLLFGVALMASPFYGEANIPENMAGISWTLAAGGIVAAFIGLVLLVDVKDKSNHSPTYRTSGRVADPMGVARAYAERHARRLSASELASLTDDPGIGWAQYQYSHSLGQQSHGIYIYFVVGVDAFGEVVGSGYSYQPVSIGPSDYPPEWLA